MRTQNTDVIGSIRRAQDTLGLSPPDAHAYVTRLLGTGMDLDEINAWIDSGTSSAKTVLNLIVLGITAEDAAKHVNGKRLGEELSYGDFKQAKRMKRARSIYANAPFEIIGEAFAEELGADPDETKTPELETLLMRWSNDASRWISKTLVEEKNIPQRSALPLAMSIILTDADDLVKACIGDRPVKIRHLDRGNMAGFIVAMKPMTQKVMRALD